MALKPVGEPPKTAQPKNVFEDRSKLDKKNEALKQERSSWIPEWQSINKTLLPRSGRFLTTDRNKGGSRTNNIYDSTGTRALRILGAGLMGGATSPARPWFRLSTPDKDLANSANVKAWTSQVTTIMLDIFARSNTYRALHNIYEELGGFGTASSIMLDDFKDVLRQYPQTIGEFCIGTDHRQVVNCVSREFDTTVGALVGEFVVQPNGSMKWDVVSQAVKNMWDNGMTEAWVTIVHMIEPRIDRNPNMRDAKNMPFRSIYWEKGQNNDVFLREGGMKMFRALCPRWAVSGQDIYGNCPGMECFGDNKQLQHQQLRKAEGIDYMTRPPLQIPNSMKNREVDRFPGGISFIDTTGPGGGAKTMFDVNLPLGELREDIVDVRQRINATFYTDLFLMLSQSDGQMTATEVNERHEEKLLMLGPVLERLHDELLNPMVEMTFQRMLEVGIVPPPPQELQGQELNVEFISVLAQAQKAVSTNSVDRFTNSLGVIATLGGGAKADVLDKFNADKWADQYSDALGVDPDLIVADKDVAIIRKNRADAQAKAAKIAQAEQGAKTAQTLSQTPTTGGNALGDITSAFQGYS